MELSDNEDRSIPDIIISRSSIPDAERARNIRMVPMLGDHEEESETDSSKESGASDDDIGDNSEDFRQQTRPHTGDNTELKMDQDVSGTKASQSGVHVQDTLPLSSTKEDALFNVFPTPNVEEYFSEYEDATDDEQVLVADQAAHQFKADTTAFEHLESSTTNEQDNADNICENCCKSKYVIHCYCPNIVL